MRSPTDLYEYQRQAVNFIISRNGSALWLDIGLGKTVISLTAIEQLLDEYEIRAALVVAPKAVIDAVWEQEAALWSHTKRLRFSRIQGTQAQRVAALLTPADIYLVNYENLPWLFSGLKGTERRNATVSPLKDHFKGRLLPFDMIVFDEISKMKTSTAKRSKSLREYLPLLKYRVGLTGSPAANGLIDLHGQYFAIDGGRRLGPNITYYRDRWFVQSLNGHKYLPRRGALEEIRRQVSDITLEMSKNDYLQLPPLVENDIVVKLPETAMDRYRQFEDEFYTELETAPVEAFNEGVLSIKCRQLANGAAYCGEGGEWSEFHEAKLDALEELVASVGDKPLLVCYQFKHDEARIRKRFPQAVSMKDSAIADISARWNRGEIKLLIGHPASMGHGLNLQYGGNNIAWFGLPWSLELYEQAIGRLLRNGQKGSVVMNHRLIAGGTVEEIMASVLKAKDTTQTGLREAIRNGNRNRGDAKGERKAVR